LLHKLKKVLWCYDPDIVKQARWPGDKIPLLPEGEGKYSMEEIPSVPRQGAHAPYTCTTFNIY
jgi:hypothetical protein